MAESQLADVRQAAAAELQAERAVGAQRLLAERGTCKLARTFAERCGRGRARSFLRRLGARTSACGAPPRSCVWRTSARPWPSASSH